MAIETPLFFQAQGYDLLGIMHHADPETSLGVVVLVGGPQYRIGSHRQFVLLARTLAASGIPVLRFDFRGMGDSEGDLPDFTEVNYDIASAIGTLQAQYPSVTRVVLWGLCDGASAALLYAYQDVRVHGLVLLNPWLHTEQGAAKTYLKHYYLKRLFSKDWWQKLLALQFDYKHSLTSIIKLLTQAGGQNSRMLDQDLDLPSRLSSGLRQFQHPVLLVLSGKDFTADEFREAIKDDAVWQAGLKTGNITRRDLEEADHTFARAAWRGQVETWTLAWLKNLQA
jgi:exosortase A-associated hydrolase 1